MNKEGYDRYYAEDHRLREYWYWAYKAEDEAKKTAVIKSLPSIFDYISIPSPRDYSLRNCADYFLNKQNSHAKKTADFGGNGGLDDMLGMDQEVARDQIDLIIQGVNALYEVKKVNMESLYDDLLRVSNMHHDRGGDPYARDKMWFDIEKNYLAIRDQIRKEQTQFERSSSFLGKELREALIEWKKQKQMGDMMKDDE